MARLRVVQVGLGDWGRDWAWHVIPGVDEVEVVAYVDSDPEALELLGRRRAVPAGRRHRSLTDALDATRADAVLVTTTLAGHMPLTRAAIEAGLHVLVEKPFTDTLAAARELVGLAAARGVVLMVSQNYRFFPAARAAARIVRDGKLGRLQEISIDFRRNNASPPRARWRQHWDPQPLLVDMSIHHLDLLRLVTGAEPDRVSCVTVNAPWTGFDGPPAGAATILFGPALVSYRGSWASAGPVTPWAGEWRMELDGGHVLWTSRGDDGVLDDRVVVTPRSGRAKALRLTRMARVDRAGTLTEFARAIREGREPETSGRDNLGTIAFMAAVVESSERGGEWIRLPASPSSGAPLEGPARSAPRS